MSFFAGMKAPVSNRARINRPSYHCTSSAKCSPRDAFRAAPSAHDQRRPGPTALQKEKVKQPMRRHSIAVLPGDGIGKEVTPAAMAVLEQAARRHGFKLETTTYPWNCDY